MIGARDSRPASGGTGCPDSKARAYAIRLLAMSDRTGKELEDKLLTKGFPEGTVAAVVADMTRLGYLDDEKLAVGFAQNCAERRGIGPWRVRAELARRGVRDAVIELALSLAFEGERESEAALSLASDWVRRHRPSDDGDRDSARRRLFGFLARRGFTSEVIERAVREVLG